MNTITYALIAISIAGGSLALATAMAIGESERRQRKRARLSLKYLADMVMYPPVRQFLQRPTLQREEFEVLDEALQVQMGSWPPALDSMRSKLKDWEMDVRSMQTPEGQTSLEGGDGTHLTFREVLLSTLDELPLEQLLLDAPARENLERFLSTLRPVDLRRG